MQSPIETYVARQCAAHGLRALSAQEYAAAKCARRVRVVALCRNAADDARDFAFPEEAWHVATCEGVHGWSEALESAGVALVAHRLGLVMQQ